jgi:hypothetical protein
MRATAACAPTSSRAARVFAEVSRAFCSYFCTKDFSKTHCYAKCSPSSVGNEVLATHPLHNRQSVTCFI